MNQSTARLIRKCGLLMKAPDELPTLTKRRIRLMKKDYLRVPSPERCSYKHQIQETISSLERLFAGRSI